MKSTRQLTAEHVRTALSLACSRRIAPVALLAGLLVVLMAAATFAGTTERVSVDSAGNSGNGYNLSPTISADGRFVAFDSDVTLVPGDTNGSRDVFVRDRLTGTTERVGVDASAPAISADSRFVAFQSGATDLVPGDTNGALDVFVYDRQTGVTERVSVDSAGNQGNDGSFRAVLSADGRLVAFESRATTLVPGDTNGQWDVFVHDRRTGTTERVSVDSAGNQRADSSELGAISADGRFVAFTSPATILGLGLGGVFVRDRAAPAAVTTTVDFDNPAPSGSIMSGDFQGIDFGTGQWLGSGPNNVNPSNHVYFADSTGTSRSFQFAPAPRVLEGMRVYSTTPGTLTLSDDAGQTLTRAVSTGSLQLVTTGWTRPATTVTVSFTNGWDLGVDDITYSTAP